MMMLKKIGMLMSLSAGMIAMPAFAGDPVRIPSPIEKVFSPFGFDNNDTVEVVLQGFFPTTCYKVEGSSFTLDSKTKTITIKATSLRYEPKVDDGMACIDVRVPFIQTVKLGLLEKGEYKIQIVDRPKAVVSPLTISVAAKSSPDDYLYAPVTSADINEIPGGYELELRGTFPLLFIGCMVVKEIKTKVTPGPVLLVQPIAEILDAKDCPANAYKHHFVVKQKLGADLPKNEDMLIHVRALDGNSVNRLINLY